MPDQSLLDVAAAADGLDADFWSLRFVEETCESFSVQRNVQQPWAVSTDRGVMVVIECARFSTRAERRWFTSIGGTIVNMTGHP